MSISGTAVAVHSTGSCSGGQQAGGDPGEPVGGLRVVEPGGDQVADGQADHGVDRVLDDPTVGVDVGARDEIYEFIAQLCREGTAVLMASSELSELLRLADRICVMHERSMVAQLDGATATEERIAQLGGGGV